MSLMVRLPDGRRLAARRFREDATVGMVYSYVDVALEELALADSAQAPPATVSPAADAAAAGVGALLLREDGGPCRVERDYELYTARPAQALPQVRSAASRTGLGSPCG